MARLTVSLPPFAPDYSGAGAVLFDLNAVIVMHDGGGCTGNYTGHDEPRWYGSKSAVFCSGLREIDAILGDDAKVEERMKKAAELLHPELMSLIGSPVPMVIGIDVKGIAAELEQDTGIPCIGLDATGMEYYDRGAFKAAKALISRFTEEEKPVKKRVNILGATPLDFHPDDMLKVLKKDLSERGYMIGMCLAMGYSLEDIKNAGKAEVNIAVSRFGFLLAEYMEKEFGIPYICGLPQKAHSENFYESLSEVITRGKSIILKGNDKESIDIENDDKVLILGEQVSSNLRRGELAKRLPVENITVGCIFGKEDALSLPQDLDLKDEKEIRNVMRSGTYKSIYGDFVFSSLLQERDKKIFNEVPLYAVSSTEKLL